MLPGARPTFNSGHVSRCFRPECRSFCCEVAGRVDYAHAKMEKRLLVVEDDTAISRLLHDNLVFEGFTVECAADGAQALEKVGTFFPDLVLLDLMLPGQSGFEVCEAMSARANRPGIIVLTSKRAESDKVRALNLGADDYVTKPFALDELLARVHAVLRRSHPELGAIAIGPVVVDFRNSRA